MAKTLGDVVAEQANARLPKRPDPWKAGDDGAIELDDQTGKDDQETGEQHWGYHLLIDCSDCNDNINSDKAIKAFFDELVKALKMRKLAEPVCIDVSESQGRGVTAFQPIDTSHISIHSDDDMMSAYIDVFSCAPYEPQVAVDCVQKWFAPKHLETLWIHRDAGKWPDR